MSSLLLRVPLVPATIILSSAEENKDYSFAAHLTALKASGAQKSAPMLLA